MAEYRKLKRKFWNDPRIKHLLVAGRQLEVLFLINSITGAGACEDSSIAGIFEIHSSDFELRIGEEKIEKIIDFFNSEKPEILEYNKENQIIFIKNFFKHNHKYKPNNEATVKTLMDSFENTFEKVPKFWAEFGHKYRKKLGNVYLTLTDESQKKFLDRLFELKNEINEIPPTKLNPNFAMKVETKNHLIL